jgi:hypothetical protein
MNEPLNKPLYKDIKKMADNIYKKMKVIYKIIWF